VTHFNANNVFNIYANVEDRDLGSVSIDIDRLIEESKATLPRGVELEVRGQIQTLNSSFVGLANGLRWLSCCCTYYWWSTFSPGWIR